MNVCKVASRIRLQRREEISDSLVTGVPPALQPNTPVSLYISTLYTVGRKKK